VQFPESVGGRPKGRCSQIFGDEMEVLGLKGHKGAIGKLRGFKEMIKLQNGKK